MSQTQIGAVILAAGGSTRLGQPKQLLRYRGETMLRRTANVALSAGCDPVIVVLGSEANSMRKELPDMSVGIVVNENWLEGMSSSIRSGILALDGMASHGQTDAALLMLCDQPLIDSNAVKRLARCYQQGRKLIVASRYRLHDEEIFGVPAIFARGLFSELKNLHGDAGAKSIIMGHHRASAFIPLPGAAFDIDTFADYHRLKSSPLGSNVRRALPRGARRTL
jgi:molybdenum cofactor cytidylyltransferase